MDRTGRRLGGDVTFQLTGDLVATAVCHCDHCQRKGGAAVSVDLVADESDVHSIRRGAVRRPATLGGAPWHGRLPRA
ncbi:MAG: hypothetical protein ABW122_08105 [Ilumatobacteraceae bacterium]